MAHQSLYRRYRPRRFVEVRGQEHVVRALRNSVRTGTEGHAYLFSGPRGTGKTSTARILAKALNCEDLRDGEPCCECSSCVEMEAGRSFDLFELDAASNNGVDSIRDLVERAAVASPGRTKMYILDEVHMLTAGASNALLKTLEEPSGATRFVLVSGRPDVLPATVRSRCRSLGLPMPAAEAAAAWLAADAGVDLAQARAWLAAAGGAPLRARRFADPAQAAIHRLIVETLAGIPETGIVQAADALADIEPAMWTATLQTWVIDLQRVCAGAEPRYFPDRADRLRVLARRTGLAALDRLAARLDRAARAVGHPLNPRLMIEDALLDVRAALAG